MAIKTFDIFVIGTGAAGKTVAYACKEAGMKVGIADNREYGGTCANRGCDPKKVLVGLTEVLNDVQNLRGKGIASEVKSSWEDLMKFKKSFTDPVPYVHEKKLKKQGIELYHQAPKFLDRNTLSVEGKTIQAKKIVIASGQKPLELKIPGGEHTLVSDDFLGLEKLPKSMVFIGGGYIGMELSHIAARMGVDTTVIHSHERPLGRFDPDMVDALTKASEEIGIKFIFNARVNKIEKAKKLFHVTAGRGEDEIIEKAEMVINAAGRIPAIHSLDLEKGEVTFGKKGITVNKKLQNPSNENVYACGDVADSPGLPLSPLSSFEANMVISQLLNKKTNIPSYPAQPSVVFTLPNVAMVGMSEETAEKQGYAITVKQANAEKWYNAKRINAKVYGYKTIVEKESGQILGAHLVGPQAAEMINLFAMAINKGLNKKELKEMIFAYPTWGSDLQSMV